MMIKNQNSLNNEKIRNASFVPVEEKNHQTFKYAWFVAISKKISVKYQNAKRKVNSWLSDLKILIAIFKWKKISIALSIWLGEVFIEGITLNFALNQLFGLRFNLLTLLAYGILINQSIDVIRRLKQKDGEHTKLLT